MKSKIAIAFFVVGFLISCDRNKTKDVSQADQLITLTDSLTTKVQQAHDQTMNKFYLLTDNSVKVDSLSRVLNLEDTVGFYQHLEHSINRFEDFIAETKQEINFARDQVVSAKTEYLENEISEKEFRQQISEIDEIIAFLEDRVDTNLVMIDKRYSDLFDALNDTIP